MLICLEVFSPMIQHEKELMFIICCCLSIKVSATVSVWDKMHINLESIKNLFYK